MPGGERKARSVQEKGKRMKRAVIFFVYADKPRRKRQHLTQVDGQFKGNGCLSRINTIGFI
jgi:hypothetical protein